MAQEFIDSPDTLYNFHPCDTPTGMPPYTLEELTEEQQHKLFGFKLQQLKDNHRYLKNHPEIRTLVNLLFHAVMKVRPAKKRIQEFLADFLINNLSKIEVLLHKRNQEAQDENVEEYSMSNPSEQTPGIDPKLGVHHFESFLEEDFDDIVNPEKKDMIPTMFTPRVANKMHIHSPISYELLNVVSI